VALFRRFPRSFVPHGSIQAEHIDVVRKVIDFIRSKGKPLQKAMVAPSGQVDQVGRKQKYTESTSCSRSFENLP
jgi:hypothetical protein